MPETHFDERESTSAPHELPRERERLEGRRPVQIDAEPHHAQAALGGRRLRRAGDEPAHRPAALELGGPRAAGPLRRRMEISASAIEELGHGRACLRGMIEVGARRKQGLTGALQERDAPFEDYRTKKPDD